MQSDGAKGQVVKIAGSDLIKDDVVRLKWTPLKEENNQNGGVLMTERRTYSKEFKLDAFHLVLEQGFSRAEAARNLDVSDKLVCRWVKEYQDDQGSAFRGKGNLTEEQAEMRRLRSENRRLQWECDFLKKAAAFFAKETK